MIRQIHPAHQPAASGDSSRSEELGDTGQSSGAASCTPLVALDPVSKDASNGPYHQHLLVRIYTLVGEPEKALDQLEPLMKIPYYVSPAWLKIDPDFDPLRQNPRFQKLVAESK